MKYWYRQQRNFLAIVFVAIALAVLCIAPALAANTWQLTNGPEGGVVRSFAIDPNNSQIVYVATMEGSFYKTNNGGASWTGLYTGWKNKWMWSLAIDPTNSNVIYAGADPVLYKSIDGGVTWVPSHNGLPTNGGAKVFSLAINPQDSQIIYAATVDGVYKTTNGGATWTAVNTGLPSPYVNTVLIDPMNAQTVYAAFSNGLYKTTNGGTNWILLSGLSTTDKSIRSVVLDPVDSQTLYAGTTGGLFKSTNGGAVWTLSNDVFAGSAVESLAIDPQNAQTLYASSTANGLTTIYKTTNGGTNWTSVYTSFSAVWGFQMAIAPSDSQTIYAVSFTGVMKTNNGGSTWAVVNTGLIDTRVAKLAIAHDSQTMYAETVWNGAYVTSDAGATWTAVTNGSTSASVSNVVIDPTNSQIAYGTTNGGVFKTTDRGTTWSAVNNGLSGNYISDLKIDQMNGQILYCCTDVGVFKTTDGGANWTAVNNGLTSLTVTFLSIFPKDSKILYARTSDGSIFKTIDSGTTWALVSTGSNGPLTMDPNDSNTLYTFDMYGVVKSTNGGASWAAAKSGMSTYPFVNSLAIDRTNSQTLYAGVYSGLQKSTNGGANWRPVPSTGLSNPYISAIAFNATGSTLYAGTIGGPVVYIANTPDPPAAPTIETVTVGDGQATLSFTAPNGTGGSPITGYTVTSYPDNITVTGTSSPITITGLRNGSMYYFTLVANNAVGTSEAVVTNYIRPFTVPDAPTIGTATAGNGQVTLSFTPSADNGSLITKYTVTASPGNRTATGTSSPITVVGLSSDTTYTFTVIATNAAGNSTASAASNAVTPYSLSGAPIIGTATAGDRQATITFAPPPDNGGSAITQYAVTSSPGNVTATGTTSPITVTGLTNGTAYTFTVVATNAAGSSIPSAASNSVMPYVPYFIVTPTAGTGGSMSPAVAQSVSYGGTGSFLITPATGYVVDSVTGCGGTITGSTYTTGLITGNCTVTASFRPIVVAPLRDGIIFPQAEKTFPDINDALAVLRHVVGLSSISPDILVHADVAPLGSNGLPQGDGKVDIADVIIILRRAVGVGSW